MKTLPVTTSQSSRVQHAEAVPSPRVARCLLCGAGQAEDCVVIAARNSGFIKIIGSDFASGRFGAQGALAGRPTGRPVVRTQRVLRCVKCR